MNGSPTTKSGINLLVVEDSPLMRARIVEHLGEIDGIAQIIEAEDVPSALQRLDRAALHAAIVDFHLPGGNGLDVIRAIKLHNQNACVIIFTTHASEQVRTACLREGADFFFNKAADFTDIENTVADYALRFGSQAEGNELHSA